MVSRMTLQFTALALLAALPLRAQQGPVGTVEFVTKVTLPDSLKAKVPLGDTIEIRVTLMGDGHRYAADIATGPSLTMFPNTHLRTVVAVGPDSIRASVIIPPALVPMAGGVPGYQVSIPVSMIDSLGHSAHHLLDSISRKIVDSVSAKMPAVSIRSLGTTSMVAGMRCEDWETVTAADTNFVCVVPTPPGIVAMKAHLKALLGVDAMLAKVPALAALQKEAFGGRDMTAIRMIYPKLHLRMELVRIDAAVPSDAMFDVPANLKVVPLPSMTDLHHGAGTSGQ